MNSEDPNVVYAITQRQIDRILSGLRSIDEVRQTLQPEQQSQADGDVDDAITKQLLNAANAINDVLAELQQPPSAG